MTDENDTPRRAEADAIARIATRHFTPSAHIVTDPRDKTELPVVFAPNAVGGLDAVTFLDDLDRVRAVPLARTGTARITTLASLIAHANRFRESRSALFADDTPQQPSLTAVFDYHDAVNTDKEPSTAPSPRHGRHRSRYAFPLSDEWKTWTGALQGMNQPEFAEFLEDHIVDVMNLPDFLTAPAAGKAGKLTESDTALADLVAKIGGKPCGPAKLMELAKGLQIHAGGKVVNRVNISSGETRLQFEDEHKDSDGQPITVPNLFLIAIPVFREGELYRIPVRLRYRLAQGAVLWSLIPHRLDLYFRTAFTEACERAATETGLPLFYGAPESRD